MLTFTDTSHIQPVLNVCKCISYSALWHTDESALKQLFQWHSIEMDTCIVESFVKKKAALDTVYLHILTSSNIQKRAIWQTNPNSSLKHIMKERNSTTGTPVHWNAFQVTDYLMKLVDRMPRVCKAVIKAKGGYFEE